jgi:hypothetical protein
VFSKVARWKERKREGKREKKMCPIKQGPFLAFVAGVVLGKFGTGTRNNNRASMLKSVEEARRPPNF